MTVVGEAFVVGTGRCGSTRVSDACRLNRCYLSLSELCTALGEEEFLGGDHTGEEVWVRLRTPTQDAIDLLHLSPRLEEITVPQEIVRVCGGVVPAILMTTLPHLSEDPLPLFEELGSYLRARPDRQSAPELLSGIFRWLARRQGSAIWVERSGGSLRYLTDLLERWPNAKIVHLYRDPVASAYSMSRHPYFRTRVLRTLHRWDVPIAQCMSMNIPIAKFGQYWSAVVLRGARCLDALPPEQVLHVRIEELADDPRGQLLRLGEFLLPGSATPEWIERASRTIRATVRSSGEPTSRERQELGRACRPGARALRALGLRI